MNNTISIYRQVFTSAKNRNVTIYVIPTKSPQQNATQLFCKSSTSINTYYCSVT
jgi:hypothetical protein